MEVGCRGDCIALDIVGGKESLPETSRGAKYIFSILIVLLAMLLLFH